MGVIFQDNVERWIAVYPLARQLVLTVLIDTPRNNVVNQ